MSGSTGREGAAAGLCLPVDCVGRNRRITDVTCLQHPFRYGAYLCSSSFCRSRKLLPWHSRPLRLSCQPGTGADFL